ncbi:hypothetical protein U9M48_006567 [Paspalum notatum var. saurae]|uniref:AIPP2-like SPOC-like domain-containing protein n=1 Tax=Paspalum notatum var. saurae TaxID=547442 RepID=A0AAQ3PUM2_PASNO
MAMRHAARPPSRPPPNPSLAPTTSRMVRPPPPVTPAARRPGTSCRAAKDVPCAKCVDGSGHSARCQCKEYPRTKGPVEPYSSDKLKKPRSSGGTYSKPDARVKLIPVEEITYVQHRKPYGKTVGTSGPQKRHCRRSVTPPPGSRRVSLVGSASLTQNPMPSESSYGLSCKRPETAENGHPFAGGHISSSVTPQITSLMNPASPSCKSSQPLSTNLDLDRMGCTKALAKSSSSSILHSQGQNSKKLSASLPKEAVINPVSPSPKQIRAPHPSDNPLGTSKSVSTSERGKLCSRNISLTARSTISPVLHAPIVDPALLSPTSVLSGRPIEVDPVTRTAVPVTQEPTLKPVLLSPVAERNESSMERKNISPTHSPQRMASTQHAALLQERNPGASINCGKSSGAPVTLHTKLHKKHYQSEAPWKGNFHVTGELVHTCGGLEAHYPFEIYVKAYEASEQMPENLNLEAVPLSQLWPKKFRMAPPDGQDLGLWFVSSHHRDHKSFDHLLEKVASHTGLWTKIGDTELAIFSSKLLTQHYQRRNDKLYFWGVFGKRLRKKGCQPHTHIKNVKRGNPSQSNENTSNKYEEVGMKLNVTKCKETENAESGMALGARGNNTTDVTGNKEIVRYDEADEFNDSTAVLGTPDSNPASSGSAPAAFLNGNCNHDSANKSTFSIEESASQPADRSSASSNIVLDMPPGFSLDVPPGFSKADCQVQIGAAAVSYEDFTCQPADRSLACSDIMPDIPPGFSLDIPPGFSKAKCQLQIGAAAVSCANATPSLILDTPPGFPTDIPPGFNESHRQRAPAISSAGPETCVSTPGAEKTPPFIRFSLNVLRPVKIEVPPGFTALHAVKKEHGLPDVDKAMEKQKLYSLVSAKEKPRKADEMKITENEVKVEQDENSEEECPKTRPLADLYPRPSDGTEFSRPTSAHLPDLQERAPKKQVQQRKRGRQESQELSPADTNTKRTNVNGRIALNNGASHANSKVSCACASLEGRAVLPTKARQVGASSGDHLDDSISCRCVVCGKEFPAL